MVEKLKISKARIEKLVILIISTIIITSLISVNTHGAPTGPNNITQIATGRYGITTTGWNVSAQAGNVTELTINATSITQTWQGYYGNVIGMIILGDGKNNTLMDWTANGGLQGQIYASRSQSITWTNVNCSNQTQIATEDSILLSTGKPDSVNNTFNILTHPQFYIGNKLIGQNNCNAVNLRNSTAKSSDWQEVLLNDDTNMIYTALLSNKKQGFNGSNYDFQMIVGENGHNGDNAATPYYFWVELT